MHILSPNVSDLLWQFCQPEQTSATNLSCEFDSMSSFSSNAADKTGKKVENKRPLRFRFVINKWMVMHLIAILLFSLSAGIIFMHTGMLWVQYMNGRSHRQALAEFYVTQDSVSFIRSPTAEQCRGNHHPQTHQQLVVNTSMYFWWPGVWELTSVIFLTFIWMTSIINHSIVNMFHEMMRLAAGFDHSFLSLH